MSKLLSAEQCEKIVEEYTRNEWILTPEMLGIDTTDRRIKRKGSRRKKLYNYSKTFVKIGRRDGFACQHCGDASNDMQIDHIHPVSKGGGNELDNLQLLCQPCNASKGAKVAT